MSTFPTFSIAIPAYNEEQNIASLLQQFVEQKTHGLRLQEIIVLSDGSTDSTASQVQAFQRTSRGKIVRLVSKKKRQGLATSLNTLHRTAKSDYLVVANADIYLPNPTVLQKLLIPLVKKRADLVAARIQPTAPKSMIACILAKAAAVKEELYPNIHRGQNFFCCYGPLRAMNKKVYKTIVYPQQVADDMFSYFYLQQHHLSFLYVHEAIAQYVLPTSLADHIKQSLRFIASYRLAKQYFADSSVFPGINTQKIIRQFYSSFAKQYPIHFIAYLALHCVVGIHKVFMKQSFSQQWEIAKSSKQAYE